MIMRLATTRIAGATAIAAVLAMTATPLSAASSASSASAPPQARITYKVVDVSTFPDTVDYTRRVAQCSAGAGGTCTITRVSQIATTVGTAFTASKGWVAGQINFSVTATNSTSASCHSPKLKASQVYRAYNGGTWKYYKLERWASDGIHPAVKTGTSGQLFAFQPHSYPDIACQVETR